MTENSGNMAERLMEIATGNILSNTVNIGNRLNLFKTIADIASKDHPVLPEQIAEKAGCKERYVREWCNTLACAKILEVNEQEQFWIADENVESLTAFNFPLMYNTMLPCITKPVDELIECFKKDGPFGFSYDVYGNFAEYQDQFARAVNEKHVIPDLVPAIGRGIPERLAAGGLRVLDVACGGGLHCQLLAEHFPKCSFIGLDIEENAIRVAKLKKKSDGSEFENLEFIVSDAAKMPEDWTNSFDLVFLFGSCHDQTRPDLCLLEINRVMKPDGVLAITDVDGSSNIHTDRETYGMSGAMKYGASMLHCLPVGANGPDALGYGSMWGRRRAIELMNKCGFPEVEVIPTTYFPGTVLYTSRK